MPARIVVDLAPAQAAHGRAPVPPPQTGPAIHAAFLGALREAGSPTLAEAFHTPRGQGPGHPARPKPFAVTPLLDEHDRPAGPRSQRIRFEVGILADHTVAETLTALSQTRTIRVARCCYQVAAITLAAAASYADIIASARPATSWTLRLLTPTGFATAAVEGPRRTRPLPEPERVFTSLYNRWIALAAPGDAPAAESGDLPSAGSGDLPSPWPDSRLPADLPAVISGHLELADFQLSVAEHLVKAGQPGRRGSVGQVTYRVVQTEALAGAQLLAGLDALMTFAGYAGIGDRTAVGMGHVQPLPSGGMPNPSATATSTSRSTTFQSTTSRSTASTSAPTVAAATTPAALRAEASLPIGPTG